MTLNMAIWRADATSLTRLTASGIALESQLEDYIEKDPTLLGDKLLLIGRQVPTGHGGYIDLLAVDADGSVHVLELKRDRTPRDVVAQLLDYASWGLFVVDRGGSLTQGLVALRWDGCCDTSAQRTRTTSCDRAYVLAA